MLRVKVCGITRKEDALIACELGADAIGFIFYPPSPRYIHWESAQKIAACLPPHVARVGVFVNPTAAVINDYSHKAGLDAVQIHGNHNLCDRQKIEIQRIIYAFPVKPDFDQTALENYRVSAAALLLDSYREGNYGGTGITFDWRIASQAKAYGRIILAGGLSPDNVHSAIEQAAPYAIDVNSGIEEFPGKKDPKKLQQVFFKLKEYRHGWQPDTQKPFPVA